MTEAWRGIGKVTSVNPAKRELRVECSSYAALGLLKAPCILVSPESGAQLKCRVESARDMGNGVLTRLVPGVSRDTVAALRCATVAIAPDLLPERPDNEWCPAELEGMRLRSVEGEDLGRVLAVMENRANAVLLVETKEGHRLLLPAVPALIVEVLHREAVMVVNPIAPFAVQEGQPEESE